MTLAAAKEVVERQKSAKIIQDFSDVTFASEDSQPLNKCFCRRTKRRAAEKWREFRSGRILLGDTTETGYTLPNTVMILYWTSILYCTSVLQYSTLVLLYSTVTPCIKYNFMLYILMHCTMLHCSALYCTELYCAALCCTVLHCAVLVLGNNSKVNC